MLVLGISLLVITGVHIMLAQNERYGDIAVNVLLMSLLFIIFSQTLVLVTALIAAITMFLYQFPLQAKN